MSLHDTNALVIEADSAAESLPDPTLFAGRTHELKNNSNVVQTWSSVGATPFTVGGVNSATLTLAIGQAVRLYSNGTRWTAISGTGNRKFFAATGTTDASGNVTFNLTGAGFLVAPIVTAGLQGALSINPVDYRITAISATSVTLNVRISIGINIALLGLTLLGQSTPLSGAVMHLIATEPGTTP